MASSNTVALNVGGQVFLTSLQTLRAVPDSMLARMFSGSVGLERDANGAYVIDRDPKHFRHVLNYLRSRTVEVETLPGSVSALRELEIEADFYDLGELKAAVTESRGRALRMSRTPREPIDSAADGSDVPVIRSAEEARHVAAQVAVGPDFESLRAHVYAAIAKAARNGKPQVSVSFDVQNFGHPGKRRRYFAQASSGQSNEGVPWSDAITYDRYALWEFLLAEELNLAGFFTQREVPRYNDGGYPSGQYALHIRWFAWETDGEPRPSLGSRGRHIHRHHCD